MKRTHKRVSRRFPKPQVEGSNPSGVTEELSRAATQRPTSNVARSRQPARSALLDALKRLGVSYRDALEVIRGIDRQGMAGGL
jgi:hypothetical protein